MKTTKTCKDSEKYIERYLCSTVTAKGGICLKYSNPNMTGFPDRIVLLPGGKTLWVELKSKGRKPSIVQKIRFRQMEEIGHHVYVCDSIEQVDEVIENEV